LLFASTEPLALLLATAFFALWRRQGQRVTAAQVAVLALGLFAREVNLFVVVALLVFLGWQRRWREAAIAATAFLPFAGWQLLLWHRFGGLPLAGNPILSWPLGGLLDLLRELSKPDVYLLSALAFLVVYLLPLLALQARSWRRPPKDPVPLLT